MGSAAPGELLSQHESASGPTVTQVRGSLIVSSLQTLRELNLIERYLARLPTTRHDEVLLALASSWLPLEVAMAHYGACEAMNLGERDLDEIGQHVSRRIMGTFLATMIRSSRNVGATPLIPLRQYHRLWDRLLVGGGCTVRTSGKKDAYIESRGVPMFRYRYFRIAYNGLIRGAGLMFARVFYARIDRATDDALSVDISWV